jgi:hypothetical protein
MITKDTVGGSVSTNISTDSSTRQNRNNDKHTFVGDLEGDDSRTAKTMLTLWSQAATVLLGDYSSTTTNIECENEDLLRRDVIGGYFPKYLEREHYDPDTINPPPTESLSATVADSVPLINTHVDLQGVSPSVLQVLDASERLVRQRSVHNANYIDFLLDDPRTMTYSRRLALFLLRRYAWYNPLLKTPRAIMSDTPASETAPFSKPKSNTVHIDSYPFTHSKRERPSLEKAWA